MIKIIDDYSLVINGGYMDDITEGEKIEIFLEGEEIKDPYNDNEVLGTLDFIKDKLEVTEVYYRFSVCEKIKKERVHYPSPLTQAFSNGLSGRTETKVSREKLNIDEEEKSGRKKDEKVIKIGDIARVGLSHDDE
ncbi:hypothetical protein CFK40_00560 [Virgibacillus necropolis]|uniref:Uncharacterized protein n=1 Tax=Virgibacillus necropolis TaxID=163877 RepID=A0A221M7L2_9BACI|nr:hypothetical protein CFK40_00560 [Virgibacillus necropolis]